MTDIQIRPLRALLKHDDQYTLIDVEHEQQKIVIPPRTISGLHLRTFSFLKLRHLDVSGNNIKYIPDITSLEVLKCNNCQLDELPPVMPNLKELVCQNNNIAKIPEYKNLTKLICSGNPITSINIQTLTELMAVECPLVVIHYIPALYNRSAIIINDNHRYLITKKEYIRTDYCLIDWRNNTCSRAIIEHCKSNKTLSHQSSWMLNTLIDFLLIAE